MMLKQHEYHSLHAMVTQGLADSSKALMSMTSGRIQLLEPQVAILPLSEIPGVAGGEATVVVSVYLGITGELHGHLVIMLGEPSARRLVDLLMEVPAGSTTTLGDLEFSALAETGNVCGSAFLNAVSDRTGLTVVPTTPVVVTDMAGAILQQIVTELYLTGVDEALMIETGFNGEVPGHFLLVPDQDSMAKLVAALEAIG